MDDCKRGMLYICATPIGNLEDITLRVLRVLREVDVIAAEDTRTTIKLLNYYEISKPLTSYHEHNKIAKARHIIDKIKVGESVALVTDAGMPGISDPGQELIEMCHKEGVSVTICPGATAGVSALVLSGIAARRYAFEGFLPRDKKERRKALEALAQETCATIIYEAPHRLLETLRDLQKYVGKREVAVVREITKKFEEVQRGDLADIIEFFTEKPPKGEFVVILEGCTNVEPANDWPESLNEHVKIYLDVGFDEKGAMKMVAKDRGVSKSIVYSEYKIKSYRVD